VQQIREKTPEQAYINFKATNALEKLRNQRIYIETYGCRYNFGDSVKLIEVLKHQGCTIVGSADEADVVIINTCTVVGTTERRMLRRLSHFRDYKLVVTGCMQAVQREAIFTVCTPEIIQSDEIRDVYRTINRFLAVGLQLFRWHRDVQGGVHTV
jgi:tRNA A37 methylthiotransferase MiaB